MGLQRSEHEAMLACCKRSISEQYSVTTEHAEAIGVPFTSLQSLHAQMYKREILRVDHARKMNVSEYVQQWEAGMSIWSIARQQNVRYSPYLMARIIVEAMHTDRRVSEYMKKPELLENERLARDVKYCCENDNNCSPHMDHIKHSVGIEYEYLLQCKLQSKGIPFTTEVDLRGQGAYKTPDVYLLVPIAMRDSSGRWQVVTWIDSKAMYGDPDTFDKEHRAQLAAYIPIPMPLPSRYGPGLVIYWFDFCEGISTGQDILVAKEFPEDLLWPDGRRHVGEYVP
ncbi:unnamed protein product [Chrysoparadoxa australica]